MKKFGFGMMRLPKIGDEFDEEQIIKMIDLFMKSGCNYFDTAYAYPGSEEIIGKLLCGRYPRVSFLLASKLPAWLDAKTEEEAKQMFYTSLERAKVDYFDYYLLHNMGGNRTEKFEKFNIWDFVLQLKKEGKIKKLGFSFHDGAKALDKVLAEHHQDVDFVQLQINYADWENEQVQSKACYEVACKYKKQIVIMEPLKGGLLANPPQAIKDALDSSDFSYSYPHWGFRFNMDLDNVLCILSGVSTLEQMEENLEIFSSFKGLTTGEKEVFTKVQEIHKSLEFIPCTNCRYCIEVCPKGISIADLFRVYNTYLEFKVLKNAQGSYRFFSNTAGKPDECLRCNRCTEVCPQKIAVLDMLDKTKEALG